MSRSRRRRRSGRGDALLLALLVVAVAVVIAVAVVHWLLVHWWILLILALIAAVAGGVWLQTARAEARARAEHQRSLRLAMQGPNGLDSMHHRQFEYAIRDLLRRDGFTGTQRIGGSNDQAVDVLGTDPNGRIWALQCKHKDNPTTGNKVGAPVLYQLAGTAERAYGATVAVVVTNGYFSAPAKDWGRQHGIHLVDRDVLARWAAGSWPLWSLLHRLPAA